MDFLCSDCPRNCNVIRTETVSNGFCKCSILPNIVRAAPHFGEEPCISGERGSGAIFFSGCNLRCVFCQNHEISRNQSGKAADLNTMVDIIHRLEDQGVHNINFVTPSHHIRFLSSVLEKAKPTVPVVWNSSGYEKVDSLKMLDGLVQIYLPDFKYMSSDLAKKYSSAPDYPEIAMLAIEEMYRQVGNFKFDDSDMLIKGIIIRHLMLPDAVDNTKEIIDYISTKYPKDKVLFSLMSQYTVMPGLEKHPQLGKKITKEDNEMMINYMSDCGIEYGFFQETESATDEMIPDFDLTGV